jgi:predicted acyl esterase
MPNPIKSLYKIDDTSFDYIYEENVTVPLKDGKGLVRCNVYRPKKTDQTYPVLVTYGPYGKDIHYSQYETTSQ